MSASSTNFKPSNMLQKYLNKQPRDMYDIVGSLMGYINADPGFKTDEFEQAVQYVLKQGISESELYAEFDESIKLEEDPAKWDEKYYSHVRVSLWDNFCRKRIEHLKAVAKKLYPDKAVPNKMAPQGGKSSQTGGAQSNGKKIEANSTHEKSSLAPIIAMIVVVILLAIVIAVVIAKVKNMTITGHHIAVIRETIGLR